jgi:uracil-DNA glycosylase
MSVRIEESWKKQLVKEFNAPYFRTLSDFVRAEYVEKKVFPQPRDVFRAFDMTPFQSVRVVILGQDPYHGEGQAHGLCFSVPEGIQIPPSLKNIYKEIVAELGGEIPKTGDLTDWAEQGVLLLNSTLTVVAGQAGSHQGKGWEQFSDAVIKIISEQKEHVVFLLWGAYAKKKEALIDTSKHLVLCSAHPSPLSAHNGFLGNGHFVKTNEYLLQHMLPPIKWLKG